MRFFTRGVLGVLITAALTGIAAGSPCGTVVETPYSVQTNQPLTLPSMLRRLRSTSPDVLQASLEARARDADTDQAGRRPNPQLFLEIEDFAGSGSLSGFNAVETSLGFSQLLELGGKRNARERAARSIAFVGNARCEAILRDTEVTAVLLYHRILAAQDFAELAQQSAELSDQLAETVDRRVEAGAAAPPERLRARADAAALNATALEAVAALETLRYELSRLWGQSSPDFEVLLRSSGQADANLGHMIETHPEVRLAEAAEEASKTAQDAASTLAVPDITVSAGIRRFEESGDSALLAGISVSLPLFDRNRGAVRAAGLRAESERLNVVATTARLQSRFGEAKRRMTNARERLALLEETALPSARAAYEASLRGYSAGRFDLTTTLNARKELLDAGVAVIGARLALDEATIEYQNLTNTPPFHGAGL